MTTYFSIKLDDATQSGIDELLRNLDSGVSAPQHELHTRMSLATADAILKNVVEDMMERFQGGRGGRHSPYPAWYPQGNNPRTDPAASGQA